MKSNGKIDRNHTGKTLSLRLEQLETRALLDASAAALRPTAADLVPEAVACMIAARDETIDVTPLALADVASSGATTAAATAIKALTAAGQDPADISESFIFSLNSNPSATRTIYLDFTGNVTTGKAWNTGYNVQKIVTPAYDTDGNTAAFSNDELREIYEIWLRVAEDYAPFDVNVTTKEPAAAKLVKSSSTDAEYGIRVCIGGSSTDWLKANCTGIAYQESFNWNTDTPCFVFTSSGGPLYSTSVVGDSAAHEAGHTLGLKHDGNAASDYYYGANDWGPIMGGAGNNAVAQWSKGEYSGASNKEDDLAIITTKNGFGYRADDHGNTLGTASTINIGGDTILATGIIERNTDVDVFAFNLDGNVNRITVGGAEGITNLDVLVKLYNANKKLIATYNPTDSMYVAVDVSELPVGKYYLSIEGTGKKVGNTVVYTDYGSIGQYTIKRDANFVVTTLTDETKATSGLSLRRALAAASVGDAIVFDPNLAGQTLTLTNGALVVGEGVMIDASDAPGLTIDAAGKSRVFTVAGGTKDDPVTIKGLTITGGAAETGAGIYDNGYLVLEDCVVTNNNASDNAGGIMVDAGGAVVLTGSAVTNNAAGKNDANAHYGGGIYLYGPMTAVNSVIADNTASANASAGSARGAGIEVDSVTWTTGAGSTTYTGSVYAENCLIVGNTVSGKSAYGGGVEGRGEIKLVNCTVANNTADGTQAASGGGIYAYGTLQAYNSIVAENSLIISKKQSSSASRDVNNSSKVVGANNLSKFTGWTGSDNYAYNANASLFADAANGDYRLAEDSQALDKGDDSFCSQSLDLDGAFRVQGNAVDLGAYERDASVLAGSVTVQSFDKDSGTATLSWEPITGAYIYVLQRYDETENAWIVVTDDIAAATTEIDGLDPELPVRFRVRALKQDGRLIAEYYERTFIPFSVNIEKANYVEGEPVSLYPTTVATAVCADIRWYRVTTNGDVEITQARGMLAYTPDFSDCDLKIVFTGTQESRGCDVEILVRRPPIVGTMTIAGYSPTTETATVKWDAIAGAAKYALSVSEDGGATWTLCGSTSNRYKTVAGLAAGSSYLFRATAADADGGTMNDYDERVFAPFALISTVSEYTVGKSIGVKAYAAENAAVSAKWYAVTPNGDMEIAGAAGYSYTPTNAEYDLRIVVTGTGDSEGCVDSITFTKPQAAVIGAVKIDLYDAAARKANLSWDPIDGAVAYTLRLSKDAGTTWTNYTTGLTSASATVSGIYAGKSYDFMIVGKSADGKTLQSYDERTFAPISVTTQTLEYTPGETITANLTAAENASVELRWYLTTPNGDMEIEEARGKTSYTPTLAGYDIKIAAVVSGNSEGSAMEITIPAAPVLGAVTLQKYNSGSHQAILQWEEVLDAVSYKLMISKDGGKTWLNYANTVTKNSAAVNGIYASRSYAFKVLARMADGSFSSSRSEGTIEPINLVTNGKPYSTTAAKNVTLQCATPQNADIRWYYITDNGDMEITDAHNLTSYKIPTADYEIKVVATGSAASEGFTASINIARPVKKITVENLSSTKANLKWQPIPGAATYTLKRSTDGGETWITYKKDVKEPSCDASGLYPGKTYMFTVTASDAAGKAMLSTATCTIDKAAASASASVIDEAFTDFFDNDLFMEI